MRDFVTPGNPALTTPSSSLGVGRISAAERVAEAASAWLGPEPFELRDRRNAGESHIGLMASDEWKVLIEAVAVWKDAE